MSVKRQLRWNQYNRKDYESIMFILYNNLYYLHKGIAVINEELQGVNDLDIRELFKLTSLQNAKSAETGKYLETGRIGIRRKDTDKPFTLLNSELVEIEYSEIELPETFIGYSKTDILNSARNEYLHSAREYDEQ